MVDLSKIDEFLARYSWSASSSECIGSSLLDIKCIYKVEIKWFQYKFEFLLCGETEDVLKQMREVFSKYRILSEDQKVIKDILE